MSSVLDDYGNIWVCGPPTAFFSVEAALALGINDNRHFLAFQDHLSKMQKYWSECNRKPRQTIVSEGKHGIQEANRRSNK